MTNDHDHPDLHSSGRGAAEIVTDPVCGMAVVLGTAPHHVDLAGTRYYFCSSGCHAKFIASPDGYLNSTQTAHAKSPDLAELPQADDGRIWTCPMHPQIRRNAPGSCPICGMALEPLEPSLEEGPNPELIDMSRRFWVSAVLAAPLVVLTFGCELFDW